MNAVHLIGRLTQDVELRERGETKVAQLRLAVPRGRDKNGEDRGADFVDVVCFGRQAEVCADYLAKGRRIAVEGRLHHDEWDGENGRRQKLEVIAQSVEFLDARKADSRARRADGARRRVARREQWRDARPGASRQPAQPEGERHATAHFYHR